MFWIWQPKIRSFIQWKIKVKFNHTNREEIYFCWSNYNKKYLHVCINDEFPRGATGVVHILVLVVLSPVGGGSCLCRPRALTVSCQTAALVLGAAWYSRQILVCLHFGFLLCLLLCHRVQVFVLGRLRVADVVLLLPLSPSVLEPDFHLQQSRDVFASEHKHAFIQQILFKAIRITALIEIFYSAWELKSLDSLSKLRIASVS